MHLSLPVLDYASIVTLQHRKQKRSAIFMTCYILFVKSVQKLKCKNDNGLKIWFKQT